MPRLLTLHSAKWSPRFDGHAEFQLTETPGGPIEKIAGKIQDAAGNQFSAGPFGVRVEELAYERERP